MSAQKTIYGITVETTIVPVDCGACGITFGLGKVFQKKRLDDGRSFYCPNGHQISWEAANREEKLRARLDSAEAYNRHLSDQRDAAEWSARAYKGQVTKVKRRVGNGVCPCCNRTFANLARHMDGQHPDYKHDQIEVRIEAVRALDKS